MGRSLPQLCGDKPHATFTLRQTESALHFHALALIPIVLSLVSGFTLSKTKMTHDLDSFMEHFEYVKNMVGIDHVGVHHAFAQALSIAATAKSGVEYEEVPYVKYLENPTESS